MKMLSEKSWSLIDPKPVVVYLTHHDEFIVYWNGVVMPYSMALCLGMEQCGIHPTPNMRLEMEITYRKLYFAGAFQTRAWDDRVNKSTIYSYLSKIMTSHITHLCKDKSSKEIIGWFNFNRARTIDND